MQKKWPEPCWKMVSTEKLTKSEGQITFVNSLETIHKRRPSEREGRVGIRESGKNSDIGGGADYAIRTSRFQITRARHFKSQFSFTKH